MNDRGPQFGGKRANAREDQITSLDCHFDAIGADPRQGDMHQNLFLSFKDVDRRLPGRPPGGGEQRAEERAMQPLRAGQHIARIRPHPIVRKIAVHGFHPPVGLRSN